jgi:hypothetical protein
MPLTKVSFSVIQVANNVTSTTVGNTTSIPSFTFDQNGVITSASNTAISGAGITANTVANSAFQTGSVESYMRGANLDFGMRNRIINGAMVIDQRNAGANVTVNSSTNNFSVDRFCGFGESTDGVFTLRQSSVAPAGFTNSLLATVTTADSSIGGSQRYFVRQGIEGYNVADLGWGTADARPVTLSFWVRSSLTGTFGGSIMNENFDRAYPFSYTISAANTWEQKSVTLVGDTTGTWLKTNGGGIYVIFSMGAGSLRVGTAGAWQTPSQALFGATGQTNIIATNGATWAITGVQFEEGLQPTPFEYRQFTTELALCQRYYEVQGFASNAITVDGVNYGIGAGNLSGYQSLPFAVVKRAAPTVTISGTWTNVNVNGTVVFFGTSASSYSLQVVNGGSAGTFYAATSATSGITASIEI